MDSFEIQKNSEFGRYLIATRDLQPGEYLFEDTPFAIGPKARTSCCCLECYCPVLGTASGSRCEKCSWPLCADCSKLTKLTAHKRECEVFQAAKCKFYNLPDPNVSCIQLDCITPLRILLEREADMDRWNIEVCPMEDHRDKRFETDAWDADQQNIVGYLLGPCKLKDRGITEEIIQKVIGILEVNTFEAKTIKGYSIRCLYTKLAISSHSCIPNTTHAIHPSDNYKMHVRATTAIPKGSQLYSCYTYTLNGTMDRQQHLMEGKYFQCHCERCSDPTELATHFSSMKCRDCLYGDVDSSNPLDAEAIWKCNKCPMEIPAESIRESLKALQNEIECTNSVEFLEFSLEEYEGILHKKHYIMISMKSALIDSYGHMKSYLLAELPDILLHRKIELCEELLSILDIFEKGMSRARALMMYELHAPIVLYARSQYDIGHLTKLEYLEQLEKARRILNESREILEWGDENVCTAKAFSLKSLKYLDSLIVNVKNCEEL
ncbi:hypothetical protein ACKWTF_000067 [Chironomus riparius]